MSDSSSPIIYRGHLEPPIDVGGWEERLKDNPIQKNPWICQVEKIFVRNDDNRTNK
jgi:hypothetical protein